jgi:hypothetical protein
MAYPQTQRRNVEFGLENLDFASEFAARPGDIGVGGSMTGQRARCRVSERANPIIAFAINATNLVPNRSILYLGAFAPLLVVATLPISFRADAPSVEASSTLNCYDSAGNYEPCETRAGTSPSQFNSLNSRAIELNQPVSWTTTALYQQAIWPTPAVDQTENWPTSVVNQPTNSRTSAPTAQRSNTSGRRSSICGRRLIPCFFSVLRRRLTHIASVVVGQPRLTREHL